MNLELNGHRITLGPKALAFIETNMRGMGEVYCLDQLALWLMGGKCDPDVTVTGPARFVAKGNEIGLPMKAGESPAGGTSTTPRVGAGITDVAAPADSEWPKCYIDDTGSCGLIKFSANWGDGWWIKHTMAEHAGHGWWDGSYGVLERERVSTDKMVAFLRTHGHAKVADELERPATLGLQVWRDRHFCVTWIFKDGESVAGKADNMEWQAFTGYKFAPGGYVYQDIITGPAADAAIKEAREQGVL